MIDPKQLTLELWQASSPENRCPHISYDGENCRCGVVGPESAVLVCGHASLQLWCLDDRYPICIYYKEPAKSS